MQQQAIKVLKELLFFVCFHEHSVQIWYNKFLLYAALITSAFRNLFFKFSNFLAGVK